jgi:starch-binding outer membrane protein, SusD/RagB family
LTASYSPAFNFAYVPYLEESYHNPFAFYQLIAQANLILSEVPKMSNTLFGSEKNKNKYIGEALFMRSYAYFYITRVWGDPVYVNKTYNNADYGNIPPLPRTAQSIVFDSCLLDLRTAANFLDYSNDLSNVTRINKGGVYALMAHIFEWTKVYDSTHKYCQLIENEGGYKMEDSSSYTNIWKGKQSNESIWELSMNFNASDPNFKDGTDSWKEANFSFFNIFLSGSLVDNQKSTSWIAPYGGIAETMLFDTAQDKRFKKIFVKSTTQNGYLLLKYSNFIYQNADSKTYPYIDNNLALFRLSDIILLDAEALAYKGDIEGARSLVKLTEDRAGIANYELPSNASDMIDEVVLERGRELIGEGQWYYDLIRNQTTNHWLENVGYPSTRVSASMLGYYWPISLGELFPYDNLLTQIPYWINN